MKKNTIATTTRLEKQIVENIELEDVSALRVENVITTFEVTYALHPETGNPSRILAKKQLAQVIEPVTTFSLEEVTVKDLAVSREIGVPSFVLKVAGNLYHASITPDLNCCSLKMSGSHKCADCHRLSATSDADGGCAKVREFSTGIERYPWITTGYETFGTYHDSFVVVSCRHYKKCHHSKLSPGREKELRIFLAQYLDPDIEDLSGVERLLTRNNISL